ncbi:peptidyl-prolyl cis-trans isomerase CYP21-4 isoform X2 [Hevea brasiliensis]|uniref:peptidyl-prolyl cis-trans isomerase CYP21-4 isoform X2 n=1 Tax=Hevea brasiliensis TaxID=3981 RepID=UPI0025E8E04B|nr:peptidyl-prolyl cis-trans isomerase CYP21-4 isoform X2 [Hevea brasiliensis]
MARIKPQALLQQSKKKKGPSRISAVTILLCGLIVLLTIFFLYSSYSHWSLRSRIQTQSRKSLGFEVEQAFLDPKKSDLPGYAILNTSKGTITVELFKDGSSEVVDKFIDLCEKGHFKGMRFRHVIKHYVIQAGDADSLGAAEDWTLKGKRYSQLDTSLKHEAFMLGTSKRKHDDKGFELFITTAPIPDLTEKLIVFGRVVKGEDVVQVDVIFAWKY